MLVDEFDELQRTLDAELEGLENLSKIEGLALKDFSEF